MEEMKSVSRSPAPVAAGVERAVEFVPFGSQEKIKLSVKIVQNLIAVPTKSGESCSERDALRFLMLCQTQHLNPFAGDAFLVGYDGRQGPQFSLITAHQAFLKRAESCPDFQGMESGIILLGEDGLVSEREGDFHLEDEKVVGGWARVHRKDRKDTYRRIRMSRFNNGFAQWAVDAAGMIVKCAEADALRSTFPSLLGGLYMQGEIDPSGARAGGENVSAKPIFEPLPVGKAISDIRPVANFSPAPAKVLEAAPAVTPAPEPPIKPSYLKAIRGLLAAEKIKEGVFLTTLGGIGLTDGSCGTLEELWMTHPETIVHVHDNWSSVLAKMRGE